MDARYQFCIPHGSKIKERVYLESLIDRKTNRETRSFEKGSYKLIVLLSFRSSMFECVISIHEQLVTVKYVSDTIIGYSKFSSSAI